MRTSHSPSLLYLPEFLQIAWKRDEDVKLKSFQTGLIYGTWRWKVPTFRRNLLLLSWIWRLQVPPKCTSLYARLNAITLQKTVISVFAAVRRSSVAVFMWISVPTLDTRIKNYTDINIFWILFILLNRLIFKTYRL